MPVFSYFIVMGFVLTAALFFVSNWLKPLPTPIATTQIGLQKPYTPEQEPSYRVTATNFAAPRKATDAMARADEEPKPVRAAKSSRKQEREDDKRSRPDGRSMADYPINTMMAIH